MPGLDNIGKEARANLAAMTEEGGVSADTVPSPSSGRP